MCTGLLQGDGAGASAPPGKRGGAGATKNGSSHQLLPPEISRVWRSWGATPSATEISGRDGVGRSGKRSQRTEQGSPARSGWVTDRLARQTATLENGLTCCIYSGCPCCTSICQCVSRRVRTPSPRGFPKPPLGPQCTQTTELCQEIRPAEEARGARNCGVAVARTGGRQAVDLAPRPSGSGRSRSGLRRRSGSGTGLALALRDHLQHLAAHKGVGIAQGRIEVLIGVLGLHLPQLLDCLQAQAGSRSRRAMPNTAATSRLRPPSPACEITPRRATDWARTATSRSRRARTRTSVVDVFFSAPTTGTQRMGGTVRTAQPASRAHNTGPSKRETRRVRRRGEVGGCDIIIVYIGCRPETFTNATTGPSSETRRRPGLRPGNRRCALGVCRSDEETSLLSLSRASRSRRSLPGLCRASLRPDRGSMLQ